MDDKNPYGNGNGSGNGALTPGIAGTPAPSTTGQQVKEQAKRLTDAVKERVVSTGDDTKGQISEKVGTWVEKLDGIAKPSDGADGGLQEQLVGRGVDMLKRLQRTLDENSTEQLIAKVGQQIKARPGLFMAGCLALGFIGARLVRK